jgi:hypothetical protein
MTERCLPTLEWLGRDRWRVTWPGLPAFESNDAGLREALSLRALSPPGRNELRAHALAHVRKESRDRLRRILDEIPWR